MRVCIITWHKSSVGWWWTFEVECCTSLPFRSTCSIIDDMYTDLGMLKAGRISYTAYDALRQYGCRPGRDHAGSGLENGPHLKYSLVCLLTGSGWCLLTGSGWIKPDGCSLIFGCLARP